MPMQEVLLPKNYSTLMAALPIYATSPDLSVEEARDLEEFRRNLPSLLAKFEEAKKQQDEYNKKAPEKVNLVNKLTEKQEVHNELKENLVAIDASISNLNESLKKAKMNKRETKEQEISLKTEMLPLEAALEELGSFLQSKKNRTDSLTIEAETSWADYKQRLSDYLGM